MLGCWRMVLPAVVDGLAGGGGWLEAYAAGWRMLAFLGAGDARRKRDAAGVMVCRGWLGGGDPAAICGGNSAVFNQLLTTFHAVAMVWRLTVFFLCSYCLFWRALPGR